MATIPDSSLKKPKKKQLKVSILLKGFTGGVVLTKEKVSSPNSHFILTNVR